MVRTNVVVDETLVQEVKRRFGLKNKREAIDFALHAVLSDDDDDEVITDPVESRTRAAGDVAGHDRRGSPRDLG